MRIAIADPPYLGRSRRWYGDGRGSGGGLHRADSHPDAAVWDQPDAHRELVAQLVDDFDAWALAGSPDSLPLLLEVAPPDARVLVWHRRNAPPSGARVRSCWEPVLLSTPRRAHGTGLSVSDVLDVAGPRIGFAGAKPPEWVRWVLDAIGYDPEADDVVDLFHGSGAVAATLSQGVLL